MLTAADIEAIKATILPELGFELREVVEDQHEGGAVCFGG
jgi:hypothetical protein